ncbi:MAG: hypothetical protein ABW140_13990 [Candidatus Sedimenticola sp. 6PFRAG1]
MRKQMANSACGSSCCQCDTPAVEIYQWVEAKSVIKEHPLPLPTFCKH